MGVLFASGGLAIGVDGFLDSIIEGVVHVGNAIRGVAASDRRVSHLHRRWRLSHVYVRTDVGLFTAVLVSRLPSPS